MISFELPVLNGKEALGSFQLLVEEEIYPR